jgi:hypothetical protein
MAKAHGKNAAVYVSQTGTGVAVPVLNLSKWSLNRDTDTAETTSFGETNKTYVQGLADLKGSISGFWDSASDPLYSAGNSSDGVKMYLYPDRLNAPTVYDYGPAWLNTSIDVDVNGAVTLSGNFMANGSWGHKPY